MPALQQGTVSVVIPFLNGGQWLREAIESVRKQTFTRWELILVDDGSTAEHSSVASEYSSLDPGKIIYIDHPGHVNKGVTVSRNLGISLCTGEYIAFLDSDDCWMPQKLETQLEQFDSHPEAGMICEASRFWYSWDNAALEDPVIQVGAEPGKVIAPPGLLVSLYPLGTGAPPCPTGIIIKRAVFDQCGGFEESFTGVYQLYEDQAFLCKVYLREKVYISGSCNNLYRKRKGSLTESANDEKHYYLVRAFFLDWFEDYLIKNNLNTPQLLALVHKARMQLKEFSL